MDNNILLNPDEEFTFEVDVKYCIVCDMRPKFLRLWRAYQAQKAIIDHLEDIIRWAMKQQKIKKGNTIDGTKRF